MQTPPNKSYSLDELRELVGAKNQENKPEERSKIASYLFNHLITESGYTFFTVTDYSELKFLFISPGVEKVTGYPVKMFETGGMEFMFSLLHPDDVDSLRLIHRKIITFFNSLPACEKLNYSYSYDFRTLRADKEYIRLHCQLDCEELSDDDHPLLGKETFTDITKYNNMPYNTLVIRHHGGEALIQDAVYFFYMTGMEHKLSKREKEINELVNMGMSSKEIGEKLHLSYHTVNTHRRKIRKK